MTVENVLTYLTGNPTRVDNQQSGAGWGMHAPA
jgi:hypothetical protein